MMEYTAVTIQSSGFPIGVKVGSHSLATSAAMSAAFPSDGEEASRAVSAARPGVMTALEAPTSAASAWAWSGPRQICSHSAHTVSLRHECTRARTPNPVISKSGNLKKHVAPCTLV